jgi:hypothetical protein
MVEVEFAIYEKRTVPADRTCPAPNPLDRKDAALKFYKFM